MEIYKKRKEDLLKLIEDRFTKLHKYQKLRDATHSPSKLMAYSFKIEKIQEHIREYEKELEKILYFLKLSDEETKSV